MSYTFPYTSPTREQMDRIEEAIEKGMIAKKKPPKYYKVVLKDDKEIEFIGWHMDSQDKTYCYGAIDPDGYGYIVYFRAEHVMVVFERGLEG